MHHERPALAVRAKMAFDLLDDGWRAGPPRVRHGQQAGRLVHNDQIVVFIDDAQVAGTTGRRPSLRAAGAIHPNPDAVAGGEMRPSLRGGCLTLVEKHFPAADGVDGSSSRAETVRSRQKLVQTDTDIHSANGPRAAAHRCHKRFTIQRSSSLGLPAVCGQGCQANVFDWATH